MIKTLLLTVSCVIYICIFPQQLQMYMKYTESKRHPFNITQCWLIPPAWVNSSCLPNNSLLPLEISLWFQVDKKLASSRSISLFPYFTGNSKASFFWHKNNQYFLVMNSVSYAITSSRIKQQICVLILHHNWKSFDYFILLLWWLCYLLFLQNCRNIFKSRI